MRYIDVEPLEDKLKEHIKKTESELMLGALSTFLRVLDITPTADVAPVRHGSWKEIFYGEAGGYTFFNVVCNCCGYDMGEKMTPFCPNCGTKMDGELIRDERIF